MRPRRSRRAAHRPEGKRPRAVMRAQFRNAKKTWPVWRPVFDPKDEPQLVGFKRPVLVRE